MLADAQRCSVMLVGTPQLGYWTKGSAALGGLCLADEHVGIQTHLAQEIRSCISLISGDLATSHTSWSDWTCTELVRLLQARGCHDIVASRPALLPSTRWTVRRAARKLGVELTWVPSAANSRV